MPTNQTISTLPTYQLTTPQNMEDYTKWADVVTGYNQQRVPGMMGLEELSSDRIAELLNPPAMFTDTSRMAAESAAGRGVSGSGAAGLLLGRMTDEERLKRIKLGSELLSAAGERYPTMNYAQPENFFMTPTQAQELRLGWNQLSNERQKVNNALMAQVRAQQAQSPSTYLTGAQQEASSRVPGFPSTYFNY